MPHLYYLPDEQLVEVEDADTILESSLCAGIPHTHVCGGSARCSTCRVLIIEGIEHCTPPNDAECLLAQRLHFAPEIRLACQTQVFGDNKITLRRLSLDAEDLELIEDQFHGKGMLPAIGQEKQIAILFADIRGFTAFAEALPPYDVIYLLNRYYHRMGSVIDRYDGIINNYMGDGLMALFGWNDLDWNGSADAADAQESHAAERAIRAALEMQAAMENFNAYVEMLCHQRLKIGIGIHYGSAVIGAIGSSVQSQQMTAIGDAVNFASRIEAANKQVGTSLLISEATYAEVRALVTVNQRHTLQIPGKSGEYVLYEITGIAASPLAEETRSPQSNFHLYQSASFQIQQFLTRCWQLLKKLAVCQF